MRSEDGVKIQKSQMEHYLVEWDSYKNYVYLAVKVIRIFHRKGGLTREKFKNMISTPAIDVALPVPIQRKRLKEAVRTWDAIDKAVRAALKEMPKKKVEF